MKHALSILTLAVFVAFFAASSTQKNLPLQAPPKQTFTYDYKAKTTSKLGSAGTLIALVRPAYAVNFNLGGSDVFVNFQQAMAANVEELLIAKGFTLKGPYNSFDEMIFNDKKDADISIEITIDPKFTASEGGWKAHIKTVDQLFATSTKPATTYYSYEGTISLIGKINIVGFEPLSKEKLLVKSIEIPPITNINISTFNWSLKPAFDQFFFDDQNVYNALGTALQKQYQGIMEKMEAHFDPQEFKALKAQIKELKSKKAY